SAVAPPFAGLTAVTGTIALLFMPPDDPAARPAKGGATAEVPRGYRAILRTPSFRIIMTGIFLCCLASLALPAQLKLILIDRQVGVEQAALMVSYFAAGIAAGRLCCGIALDRFPPQIVAAIALGLPSIGLLILATGLSMPLLLSISVALVGLAMGAELDIATYLVMRWFRGEIYSSVYGLIAAGTALSGVGGSLLLNYILAIVHGTTTSSTVFGRLIALRFERARGLALSIMAGTPAVAAAIAVPLLTATMESHGWRAAYLALGAIALVSGLITLMLIPGRTEADVSAARAVGSARRDYPMILRTRTFQIILVAMLACNLTTMVFLSQLKLILIDRQVDEATITSMISLYVTGMLVGRLGCGLALDRFPAHIVSAICMALPAIGIFILASGISSHWLLICAVSTVGMALGAELDIGGYLVMRFFRPELYGTVYSMSSSMIGVSGAIGALLLSFTLKLTGDYNLYLIISGISLLLGAALFLSLGKYPAVRAEAH
ncbi:MAG: MFS transporter, partial [Sphingomonadales bacterium]